MGCESLEIVFDADARRGAGVESGQAAVFQRDFVVESDELEEHVADQEDQISHVAGFVLQRHELHRGLWATGPFG